MDQPRHLYNLFSGVQKVQIWKQFIVKNIKSRFCRWKSPIILPSRYYVTFPFSFFFFPYFFSLCLSAYQSGCLFKLFYVYFLSYFDLQFNFFLDIYFFLFTRLCLFFDLFSVYAFASCLSSFLLAWVEAKEWLRTTSHSHHSPHITIFKRWSLKEREMPSSQKSKCKLH